MAPGRREALILGGAGLVAVAAGFLAGPALLRMRGNQEEGLLGQAAFTDLDGKRRRLAEWQGKAMVCNFWATWCAPCREEIPLLSAASQKYGPGGVQIVGIAIDKASNVRQFSASLNISYPVLLAEANGLDLMRQLGNNGGGLPYTVFADRQGAVLHRKLGALKAGELEELLASLTRA